MILSIPREEIEDAINTREARFPSITSSNQLVQESSNPIQSFIKEYVIPFNHLERVNTPSYVHMGSTLSC
jgi:hypothetical protein